MNPYLLLAAAEGCGPGMIAGLLDPTREPADLLARPPQLPNAAARRLKSPNLATLAKEWLDRAEEHGLGILTPDDPRYPDRMRDAPLRPNALFTRGDPGVLDSERASLAVVGSRTHTAYGEAAARDFSGAAARARLILWSGLALGVDGLAHREALNHDTPTVGVLAGGLDQIYPQRHVPMAEEIVARGGVLVSESPPGMRARRGHFPRRNRILATGAQAVLVVEAGLRSGTLHTARFATELGVPVFAVPGPYTSPRSLGCHSLIAEGASIASSPVELLRDLGIEGALQHPAKDETEMEFSADAEAILQTLQSGPRPADLVARESGLEPGRFMAAVIALTELGWVRQLPGDLLALVRSS